MFCDLTILASRAPSDHVAVRGMLLAAMFCVFLLRLRLLACAAVLTGAACAVAACEQADVYDPIGCEGGKCDDPTATPTPHALAVLACEQAHSDDLDVDGLTVADQLEAEKSYRACLTRVDDAAVVTIGDNLLEPESLRSLDEIGSVFAEFRYASLCVDIESASSREGDELDLLVAECDVLRERSLAQAVGALVDFTGERTVWELGAERTTFVDCYRDYDQALSEGLTPSQNYLARQELVACSADDLRADSELIKDAQCQNSACGDELLALSYIRAGFDTAIVTTDRVCDLLVDASIYREASDGSQVMDCQIALYAQLKRAVQTGLE